MTEAEVIAKVGPIITREFEIVNVSCWDESRAGFHTRQVVYLGTSSNGTPAWVNQVVAAADVRIGIGDNIPHSDAGHGRAAKVPEPQNPRKK